MYCLGIFKGTGLGKTVILKYIFKQQDVIVRTVFDWLSAGPVTDSERSNQYYVFTESSEILACLRDFMFSKNILLCVKPMQICSKLNLPKLVVW